MGCCETRDKESEKAVDAKSVPGSMKEELKIESNQPESSVPIPIVKSQFDTFAGEKAPLLMDTEEKKSPKPIKIVLKL